MRRVGPLIVVLILCVIGGVGATYYAHLKQQAGNRAKPVRLLPLDTTAAAQDWTYTQTKDQKPVVSVRAKEMQEVGDKYQLTGVELHLFHKDGDEYDQVTSAKAEFDIKAGDLYSEGAVQIIMSVPKDEGPNERLMHIESSGVHFESKTGKAYTDRPASFHFDRGDGKAVGAAYDPNTRELVMKDRVKLVWRGSDPATKPMEVETHDVLYREKDSKVYLAPWSKLKRDTLSMTAGPAEVTLADGVIRQVNTTAAQGTDNRPNRAIGYSADQLSMQLDENGIVRQITGTQNARLVSTAETTVTTISGDRVDMDFATAESQSTLQNAVATGHAVAESKPIPKPGVQTPDTRILRSSVIRTKMRAGGEEIEAVETDSTGNLEFAPNRPGQAHRFMDGDRIWIAYGPKNQIETARSINVKTRTENPRAPGAAQPPPPATTSSKELLATFEPNSSQLAKLEQWDNFQYQAGDRRATAERAVLDQAKNVITLVNSARVWDTSGTTSATIIVMDQKNGTMNADGNVDSVRMPDKKNDDDSPGMLSNDEPLHAKAKRMISRDNNQQVKYEGNAILWQGSNRLTADVVDIDRENNQMKANGHVVSQLLDKAKDDADGAATKPKGSVFTTVKAPELFYDDDKRLAIYKGGAVMTRPNMQVRAEQIQAFLRDDSDDSSLDHAFADGHVEIQQNSQGRARTGSSAHSEYYVDEDKVILEGGKPVFVDSVKGTTHGAKLTWFSKDDRLLVNGVEKEPAKSVLRKKNQ